jgi:F0F1-type ATP synthase gamma subunit
VVTYHEHLKKILIQFLDSYDTLKEFEDKPGDLENVKRELLKINGFLKVITKKYDSEKIIPSDFDKLKIKFEDYLNNYYFEKEIETLTPLYVDDVYRIKNMRLKILDALEDREMIYSAHELIEQL